MPSGREHGVPWDEGAALEELERLKRGIEEWRRRRKDVQADFDRFVRGFRTPPSERETGLAISARAALQTPAVAPDRPSAQTPAVDTSATAPAAPLTSVTMPTAGATDLAVSSSEPAPLPDESSLPPIVATVVKRSSLSAQQRRGRTLLMAVAGGAAVLITVVTLLTRTWNARPDGSSSARAQPAAARATQVPRSTAPSHSTPNPVAPEAPRSEITALRRVWVRVVVDGTREVERELNAGDRIALRAGRTSVIRAGNAGAVRVTINGEDRGLLGPEGEVVTRTLQIPAAANR
jgi:hypothetical protein